VSDRIRKVNELIREEVSKAISEKINHKYLVTVKAVETERDLKNAIVWVSVLNDQKEAWAEIQESARNIEHEVRSKMVSKYTPKLEFKLDKSEEHVAKIDALLHEK